MRIATCARFALVIAIAILPTVANAKSPPLAYEIALDAALASGALSETLLLDGNTAIVAERGNVSRVRDLQSGDRVVLDNGRTATIRSVKSASSSAPASPPPRGGERVVGTARLTVPFIVRLAVGDETIEASPEHRFAVHGKGWVRAGELARGDMLDAEFDAGAARVASVERTAGGPRTVYNLVVEVAHTFRVGRHGVLVHNGDCVVGMKRKGDDLAGVAKKARPDAPGADPWEHMIERGQLLSQLAKADDERLAQALDHAETQRITEFNRLKELDAKNIAPSAPPLPRELTQPMPMGRVGPPTAHEAELDQALTKLSLAPKAEGAESKTLVPYKGHSSEVSPLRADAQPKYVHYEDWAPAMSPYHVPREAPADEVLIQNTERVLGKNRESVAISQISEGTVFRHPDGRLHVVRPYSNHPGDVIDRVNWENLVREYGVAAPQSMVIKRGNELAYAAPVVPVKDARGVDPYALVRSVRYHVSDHVPGAPFQTKGYLFLARDAVRVSPNGPAAGHIGWGFQVREHTFVAGATENPSSALTTKAVEKGAWRGVFASEEDMLNAVRERAPWAGYSEFTKMNLNEKSRYVSDLDRKRNAMATAVAWEGSDYSLLPGKNCLSEACDVLTKGGFVPQLGGGFLTRGPNAYRVTPNGWYDSAIQAGSHTVSDRMSLLLGSTKAKWEPSQPLFTYRTN